MYVFCNSILNNNTLLYMKLSIVSSKIVGNIADVAVFFFFQWWTVEESAIFTRAI